MSTITSDVIDLLAGIAPGSRLDELRAQRAEARENTQKATWLSSSPMSPATFQPWSVMRSEPSSRVSTDTVS